jgi:transketolase
VRDAFSCELSKLAAENPDLFLLTADIGFQVFDQFRDENPDRFYNMGVAEANMMGVATGLALSGKCPYVYTIVPFLTMRAYEQIRTDVCIQNQPVKIVGVGGGVSYGRLGPTHHSLVDLAIMRALPNMTVIAPCDPLESRKSTRAIMDWSGPVYVRLGKNGEPDIYQGDYRFQIGKAVVMREGKDATLIATGSVLRFALETAQHLSGQGISVRIVNMHTIKPIDAEIILQAGEETKFIGTMEEHNIIGGLGSAVAEVLVESGCSCRMRRFGIKDAFCYKVGSQQYHLEQHGMSVQAISDSILRCLGR